MEPKRIFWTDDKIDEFLSMLMKEREMKKERLIN